MEDAKLQALHDTLSQIRGKKGLGTNTQFSWQRGTGATQTDTTRHPLAAHLPDNALYAHFLPEGVYDPSSKNIDYGDGRAIKRDFSDAIIDDDNGDDKNNTSKKRKTKVHKDEKIRQKEIRKAEKKAAKKADKLKAKREAKIEEKKRQNKLEKKQKKEQSSEVMRTSPTNQLDHSQDEDKTTVNDSLQKFSDETTVKTSKVKGKKKDKPDIDNKTERETKKVSKKSKKAKGAIS